MKRFAFFLCALLLAGCQNRNEAEYTETEIPTGYTGVARVNPYLAAERFLKESGFDARSSRVWSDFGYETSTVVMPGSFLSTKGLGMRMLEWVEEGGMAIITLSGGEAEINDFNRKHWSPFFDSDEEFPGLDYVLEEVGIEVSEQSYEIFSADEAVGHLSEDWNVAEIGLTQFGEEYDLKIEFEGTLGMQTSKGEVWETETRGARMVTVKHGLGKVMVLSHARPFRNAYVDRADHAQFLEVLANWHDEGEFVFLYGSGTSFAELMWQHAWQALVGGGILLLVWLWYRIPRFGPLKEDDFTHRRPYGDALKASAKFLWRKNAVITLIRPLRAELEQEVSGDEARTAHQLSAESGLTPKDVGEAMYSQDFKDPGTITRIVQKLQILKKR